MCAIAFTSIRPSFSSFFLPDRTNDQLSIEEISLERPMDGRAGSRPDGQVSRLAPEPLFAPRRRRRGDDDGDGGDSAP